MTRAAVIGAAGGIGALVRSQLESAGVDVAAVDRRGDVQTRVDLADLDPESAFSRWLSQMERAEHPYDVVVWSAAVYHRRAPGSYTSFELEDVARINLLSYLRLLTSIARVQASRPSRRRLVALGSQAGAVGGLDHVYAATKAGLVAATKSLAREFAGAGLVANVVSPGPTNTAMARVMGDRRTYYESVIPAGRFNEPGEVADVVSWLALEAPVTLTGTVVDIDGGQVRR